MLGAFHCLFEQSYTFFRAETPNHDEEMMSKQILHRILAIKLPMHDFLHAHIGRIYQNFIIHVGTEEPFPHSRLEEAKAVITFLGMQLRKNFTTRGILWISS